MNAIWIKIVTDAADRVKEAFRAGSVEPDEIDMAKALSVYAEPPEGTPETWFCADVTILAAMALQALEQPPKISVGAMRRVQLTLNSVEQDLESMDDCDASDNAIQVRTASRMIGNEILRSESPDWNKAADVEWFRGRYPNAKWDEDAEVLELEIGCIKPITLAYSCGVGWHLNGRFIWLDCTTITRRMVVDLIEALNK